MSDDYNQLILTRILEAGDGYISGNKLAKELSMSRVGIWARLEKLREQGFIFDAVRHRGYRLISEPETLCAPWLKAILAYQCSDMPEILVFPELDSTNQEAMRQLLDGREAPFAILAERQNQGRGRMGRTWHSPDEGNIYLSIAFRPNIHPGCLRGITPWAGLVIAKKIKASTGTNVQIKWPNDLLVGKRKVGGILMEARLDADRTHELVLGIGLNVNSNPQSWDGEPGQVATSLADKGGQYAINRLAADIICAVINGMDDFIKKKHLDTLLRDWPGIDAIEGHAVKVHINGGSTEGIACGINEHGELLLEMPSGERKAMPIGEVSIGTAKMLG